MDIYSNKINFNLVDFDIYAKRVGFFLENKEKIGSKLGFVLTILYVSISFSLFMFYTILTIKRTEINVHDSTMYLKDSPDLNINPEMFYFAFGVENPGTNTRFIDETIYTVRVKLYERIKDGSTLKTIEEKILEVERCKQEKFGEIYQKLFAAGELNDSYCINDINLTLSSDYQQSKLSYLNIEIHSCVNTSNNNNHCKPREEIDSYLSGTFISFLAKDIGLDPSNYTYPIVPMVQNLRTTIDKNFFRDYVLYFGLTEIQTDKGLFYESIHKERYMNFIKSTQSFYNRDEQKYYNGDSMCDVQFKFGDDIHVQKRSFMKMTEVFAITGGYMQLLSTIFTFTTLLSNKLGYEIKLVNSLFNFDPKKRQISLKHELKGKIIELENNIVRKNLSQIDAVKNNKENDIIKYNNINIKKNSNNISDKNKNKNIKITLSHNNLFKLCSLNNNNNLYPRKSIFVNKSNQSLKEENGNKISHIDKMHKVENLSKSEKDKEKESISEDNNSKNKSKVCLLSFEVENKNNYRLFNNNQIIKQNDKSNIILEDIITKNIRINVFYYYCFSKFIKDKSYIDQFKFALSFLKNKMDIIYLLNLILSMEKLMIKESSKSLVNK